MSVTLPVRTAVANLIRNNLVQPSKPDGDLIVYVYPEDDDPEADNGPIKLDLENGPRMVIQKGIYKDEDGWKRVTQATYEYTFAIEIMLFLGEHVLPNWEAQQLVEGWQTAIADVILAQPTLNGSVIRMEQNDSKRVLTSRDGDLDWYTQDTRQPKSYWGIGWWFRVTKEYPYAEIVGVE